MQEQPTRHDLEFMARMLGITGLCASLPPPVPNRAAVEHAMADPIANARARQRISDLLMQCEQVERTAAFPDMGATIRAAYHERIGHVGACATCNLPFAYPAGVTCQQQERHAPPLSRDN